GIRYVFEPDAVGGSVGTLKLFDIANPTESSITIKNYTLGQLELTETVTASDEPDTIPTEAETYTGTSGNNLINLSSSAFFYKNKAVSFFVFWAVNETSLQGINSL
ncbi:MAG: hypothetical protein P1P93_05745, partial [Gammaproteobacteria bacterium]|nr:hypothetical protein [Gammaproteobacteria bacterium]